MGSTTPMNTDIADQKQPTCSTSVLRNFTQQVTGINGDIADVQL